MDLLGALQSIVRVVPSGFLGVAALQIVQGFVEQKATFVTIDVLREGRAAGWTFKDVFGMADPQLQQIMVTITRRAPGILDQMDFLALLKWTGNGNPQLVSDLVQDQEMLAWARQSWKISIEEFRQMALAPQEV